jgi:hypothetical protein
MLKWFDTAQCEHFAADLAGDLLQAIGAGMTKRDAKFAAKAEKALLRADGKVRAFRARERMNFYKKSKLANRFLWTLKDAGCPGDYATELTEWLTFRL